MKQSEYQKKPKSISGKAIKMNKIIKKLRKEKYSFTNAWEFYQLLEDKSVKLPPNTYYFRNFSYLKIAKLYFLWGKAFNKKNNKRNS